MHQDLQGRTGLSASHALAPKSSVGAALGATVYTVLISTFASVGLSVFYCPRQRFSVQQLQMSLVHSSTL